MGHILAILNFMYLTGSNEFNIVKNESMLSEVCDFAITKR